MRPLLVLVAGLAFPALAAELPSIDTPLRTGLSAKGDAAVVIGVEDYVYLPDATYASQDAQAMYDFLVYTRGVPSSRVALLQGGTSRRKIIEAVTTAGKQVGAGGTVWVYFAGHGSASPSTRERLILPENTLADAEDFDEQGVRLAELQRLAGSGGGEVLLITDACFTGAGRAGGTLLSGGRAWVPPQATAVGRSVQWDAAQANQVAGPLAAARHGAFTYFAIGAMRGWADGQVTGERDGVVTSEEAQLYVQEALRAVGIREQAPSLVGEGAATRTLASGARERAPSLGDLMATPTALAPVAVGDASVVGGAGFQAELEKVKREAAVLAEKEFRERAEAQARARAAETERVESERRAAAAAVARKVKLDAAEASLRAQATSDWGAAKGLVDGGGAGAKAAAEAFVKAYEGAKVSVDTEDRLVAIPELAAAKKVAALKLVETAAPAAAGPPSAPALPPATPPPSSRVLDLVTATVADSGPSTVLDGFVAAARAGKLDREDVSTLTAVDTTDPQYTRSRALLLVDAQKRADDAAVKKYLDQLMVLPENQYNPVFLADLARWHANHGEYERALEKADKAERYSARLPSELVFSKTAEIYEIQAAATQGRFYRSKDDLELLDRAVAAWEKYREHVATRERSDLVKRADDELAKLAYIKERLQ